MSEQMTLQETCFACPEQYDAFDAAGNYVGYLRLRHGRFTAEAHLEGQARTVVYEARTNGDGRFDDDERDRHLTLAVEAILKVVREQPRPNYRIENSTAKLDRGAG